MRRVFILLLRGYQLAISPWLGARCRFTPSCSQYAIEAFTQHGSLKGGLLTIRRLSRCHPWGKSGYDPVPGLENHRCVSRNQTLDPEKPGQTTHRH